MWKLINKPQTVRVTKSLVDDFVTMEPAPADRALSERRLLVYQRILADGTFRPCTWAKATCKETGGIYRVNGKHTSTLLSGLDKLPEFYVTVEHYDCDTLEDLAKLYATFDTKMQSRSANDINRSFAATVPEYSEIGSKIINLAVSGMGYHTWLHDYWNKQAAERAELLLENLDFVTWLDKLLVSKDGNKFSSRHLLRGPVTAAMFGSFSKAKQPATEFWTAVRDDTGDSPSSPDRRLSKFLLMTSVNMGRGVSKARCGSPREFYVKSIHAWNAWRRKDSTDLKFFADRKNPSFA